MEKFKIFCHRNLSKHTMLKGVLNGIYRQEIFNPRINLVYLDLTNNCNLRCEMCFSKQQKIGYMSRSLFESCVNQLSQIGVETLYLYHEGESLLHPDFKEYLRYTVYHRDHGKIQSVAWIDNGMLFDQSIADLAVDLKVDLIGFSIDGVGEVNDKIRLGSRYAVIERNIKYLIKKRGDALKPKVLLCVVDYGKTEKQKMDVYREWLPFVDEINLIPFIRHDKTCAVHDNHKTVPPPAFCHVPFQMMIIGWDGKVTGCCIDYMYKLRVGDAAKESLRDIWQGLRYQTLRKAALANNFLVGSPCQKCEFWKINFEPSEEELLDGGAVMKYDYMYRIIRRKGIGKNSATLSH